MRRLTVRSIVCFCMLLMSAPALAADLFVIRATTTDGGAPVDVRVGGSRLIDLAEDAITNAGRFADFANRGFTASLTYGGVRAIVFDLTADGTQATLSFPLTGFSRTFTGADRDELEDKITDFIKKDGSKEYAKLLSELNKRTVIALVDGNPGATTANIARQTYRRFGLGRSGPHGYDPSAANVEDEKGRRWWFAFSGIGDYLDADKYTGYTAGVDLSSGVWLSDTIGLSLSTLVLYQEIESASAFQGGLELGLPIRIIRDRPIGDEEGERSLSWQVTPVGLVGLGGSVDMAAGGLMVGGGVASRLSFDLSEQLEITIGNQIAFFEGLDVSFRGYDFDTEVSQQVLTNGVLASYMLSDTMFIEGGASYTTFLSSAAVDGWISPTVGVGWRSGGGSMIGVSYDANFGNKSYTSHSLMLRLQFEF